MKYHENSSFFPSLSVIFKVPGASTNPENRKKNNPVILFR